MTDCLSRQDALAAPNHFVCTAVRPAPPSHSRFLRVLSSLHGAFVQRTAKRILLTLRLKIPHHETSLLLRPFHRFHAGRRRLVSKPALSEFRPRRAPLARILLRTTCVPCKAEHPREHPLGIPSTFWRAQGRSLERPHVLFGPDVVDRRRYCLITRRLYDTIEFRCPNDEKGRVSSTLFRIRTRSP